MQYQVMNAILAAGGEKTQRRYEGDAKKEERALACGAFVRAMIERRRAESR